MSNPSIHAKITQRNYGGNDEDFAQYYKWHEFMDISKEAESSNRHRAMSHQMLWVRRVMIPIFGATYKNADRKIIDIKDCMESDHIVVDFNRRFLPNLKDYVDLIDDGPGDEEMFKEFHAANHLFYQKYPEVKEFLMAPLGITGKVKSLLVTCNSWMINEILPRVYKNIDIQIRDFNITPKTLFDRMNYAPWINNGHGSPPSYAKIMERRKNILRNDLIKDVELLAEGIIDGPKIPTRLLSCDGPRRDFDLFHKGLIID